MARSVAIRLSWRNDAAYLLRLEEAIEKDESQSPRWRRETWRLCRRLAQKFLAAEQRRVRVKKEGDVPETFKRKQVGAKRACDASQASL